MADVSYLISLGIGGPEDIAHFILFGLCPRTPPAVTVTADYIVAIPPDDVVVSIQ